MARIAISLSGEGRGHATRAAAMLERLAGDHEVRVYAPTETLPYLRRVAEGLPGRVDVHAITGLVVRSAGRRPDLLETISAGCDYHARTLGPLVERLIGELDDFGADLGIVDCEPALPRACARLGVPVASVDHRHFLLAYDLGGLPGWLRWRAWMMGHAVAACTIGATDTVVSAFFRPPLRPGWEHVVQVGTLVRREIREAVPEDRGFLVSRLRPHTPFATLAALADCGLPVRVYGLGARDPLGPLGFHDDEGGRFVEDLVGCRAVVAAAGSQLVGEALHLGKPVLALPEAARPEQRMSAWFLAAMGCGESCPLEQASVERVAAFVAGLDGFARAAARLRGRIDGTGDVSRVIGHRLAAAGTAAVQPSS